MSLLCIALHRHACASDAVHIAFLNRSYMWTSIIDGYQMADVLLRNYRLFARCGKINNDFNYVVLNPVLKQWLELSDRCVLYLAVGRGFESRLSKFGRRERLVVSCQIYLRTTNIDSSTPFYPRLALQQRSYVDTGSTACTSE